MSYACRCRGTGRSDSRELQRFGRLRRMRMLWASVDLELGDLSAREPVLREHPPNGLADHFLGAAPELFPERSASEPAWVAGMAVVPLLVELVPGDLHLLGIHDDDEVAGVDVRRVLRLALP